MASVIGCSDNRVPGDERILLHDNAETDEDYYYTHRELWTPTGMLNKQGHYVERYP